MDLSEYSTNNSSLASKLTPHSIRMIILWWMFILMNFSGAVVLNYYSPTLFTSVGIASGDVAFYTGIYGLVKVRHMSAAVSESQS